MVELDVDVLIVGGGIIGVALFRALEPLGYRVLLVDDKQAVACSPSFDARSLALSPASLAILDRLGVLSLIESNMALIDAIHVSEQGAFGQARLFGTKQQPLGAVVEMDVLRAAFGSLNPSSQGMIVGRLIDFDVERREATIRSLNGEMRVSARLVIGADGADSMLRQCCHLSVQKKDYSQHALVANIGLLRAHRSWAYERFTSDGPLALLPMTGLRASLVWALTPPEATRMKGLSEDAFLSALQRAFGYRLGRFIKVGRRAIYPLRQVVMTEHVIGSVVFIGNAAHTLHPVAGQGFNLGLRDVAALVQCIAATGLGEHTLKTYQELRRDDQRVITLATDGLVSLFTSQRFGVGCARRLGLIAMDNSAVLKKVLSRYASGFGGVVPDLVCGIPLAVTPKHVP